MVPGLRVPDVWTRYARYVLCYHSVDDCRLVLDNWPLCNGRHRLFARRDPKRIKKAESKEEGTIMTDIEGDVLEGGDGA
jgi:hypothetical protein